MTHVHAEVALYEAMQAALLVGFVFMAMLPSEHMQVWLVPSPPYAAILQSQRADTSAWERLPNVFVESIAGQEREVCTGQAGGSDTPVMPPLPEALVPPVATTPPDECAPPVPRFPPDEFRPPVAVALAPAAPPCPAVPPVEVAPPFSDDGEFEVPLEHATTRAAHAPSPKSIIVFGVRLRGFMSCLLGPRFGSVTVQQWNRDLKMLAQNPSVGW